MNAQDQIVWIDDNPGRESTARDVGARFVNVKGRDLAPEIKALLEGTAPKIVIIDHILDKAATTTHPVFLRGSTIAEAIKEKWPSCAVLGVTNAHLADIDLRTKRTYDALFPFHNFSRYIARIEGIASGFDLARSVARKARSNIRGLLALLKPPDDEVSRLADALADLKSATQKEGAASSLYRCVDRLMSRPGFLFDSLWTATFLGLTQSGFMIVEKHFNTAQYSGLFARPDEPFWWASRLSELLYRHCRPEPGELSWHVGRRLSGIRKEHYSRCYYCNGPFPETVGYLDEVSKERRAMHLKCTVLHPLYRRELYFEDVRMMLGKS
jgi:hypothetical protein